MGWGRYHLAPTLCWFSRSDTSLSLQCAIGAVLGILVLIGVAPAPCLFLLWLIYLSLATVSREFLGFQWDALLLETGFLAIFFAPLRFWLGAGHRSAPPRIVIWLLRLLMFRLMFESGFVKLSSHDPTWKTFTALHFHYETQPLPTWIGWYAHQLPAWAQKTSTVIMFFIELVFPLLIFAPRRFRLFACAGFAIFQMLILLTGNYCFFNLLALALCLPLLDDAAFRALLPARWRPVAPTGSPPSATRWPLLATLPLAFFSLMT